MQAVKQIDGCGPVINATVTSPQYKWMGHELANIQEPLVLAMLFGKNVPASEGEVDEDGIGGLRQRCRDADIKVLFFEKAAMGWRVVPTGRIGTPPYQVSEFMTINFFHEVDCFSADEQQYSYLRELGLAIDGEFVSC